MNTGSRIGAILAAIALFTAGSAAAPIGRTPSKPKAQVHLVSSVEAVVPGQPFDAAVQFELVPGWHIYWKNSGDSGQPPRVTWSLPPGFTAGDLRFPVPKRHAAAGGIVTNVLEGEPILPVRISVPASIDDATVALRANVHYLVCREICLIESADLKLPLPVGPPGTEPKAANEALFRRARKALPKESSKYLSISTSTEPAAPVAGREFQLLLTVHIKPGFHIQSHTPLNPNFIACDVFLERADGIRFLTPVYPPPHLRTVKYLGKVSEYQGRITLRVPGEVEAKTPPGPRRLGGVFKYQACNDQGTCFPPEAVAFSFAGSWSAPRSAQTSTAAPPTANVTGESASPPAVTPGAPGEVEADDAAGGEAPLAPWGLPGVLIACFLYGLAINATPCVLPILSIKILGFVQQAHESRSRTFVLGLAFGAGVLVFFVVLGFLARAGGNVLQFPAAVVGLSTVVLALALSMLGVYTLQVPRAATKLEASIQREGVLSSFGKGALAPVLGFACTAPFLAGAFGWATQQPPHVAVFAFLFSGLGMASPYVLLGANPNWLSFLPKPGPWMITFERIMGFLLLAMVIWLLHPLITQLGPEGLEWTLGFLVGVGMACWLLGRIEIGMSTGRRWCYRGGAALIVAGVGLVVYGWGYGKPAAEIAWEPWSPAAVEEATRAGHTVFVDVTAAYCTNCKVNKAVAINQPEVQRKIRELGVRTFQADFTSGDEQIAAMLRKHGRAGVPLDLIYPAGRPDQPIVLTTLFTKEYLIRKLDEAGPSRATASSTPDT